MKPNSEHFHYFLVSLAEHPLGWAFTDSPSSIDSWGDAPGGENTQHTERKNRSAKNYKLLKHDLSMLGTSLSNQMLPNVWH